jgi:hypothetical protein
LRTRFEIKRIELFSLFKLAFYIYAVIGLFFAIIYGFFLLVIGGIQSAVFGGEIPQLGAIGVVLGIMAIPIVALMYGAVGSVFMTIGGWLFNIIAGAVGGLRVQAEVEEVYAEPPAKPAPQPAVPPYTGGSATPPDGPTLTRSSSLDDD